MSHHLPSSARAELCVSRWHAGAARRELRIPHGEAVAVIGANGAGKSTLLMQLNGLLLPSAGEVRIGDCR